MSNHEPEFGPPIGCGQLRLFSDKLRNGVVGTRVDGLP